MNEEQTIYCIKKIAKYNDKYKLCNMYIMNNSIFLFLF